MTAKNPLENLDRNKITKWFDNQFQNQQPFFYNSVDIRNSGFKIAPVDTNLFPAGFNNLSKDAVVYASEEAKNYLSTFYPKAKNIAILTENFDRNQYYFDNIAALKNIITSAGYNVSATANEAEIKDADLIIANKDFTGGELPKTNIPIIPSPDMGWHTRRKSQHFASYDIVARDFAEAFSFDPWLISTLHQKCGMINFKKGEGFECLADNANNVLSEIRSRYNKYGIESDPYLFIKADSGTFGMGIMTIKSIMEITEMNKKIRNKMDRIKEGVQNTEVIIQEGVPTIDQLDGKTAEPFIYCINGQPIGAILRVNENRDEFGNLNSAGMTFEPLECKQINEDCEFTPLGIIARLASLAAMREAEIMKQAA